MNTALNNILSELCKNIATPTAKAINPEALNQRLLEQIEIRDYPYPELHCTHKEALGIGEDCVSCQQVQYETYQSRFQILCKEHGLQHTHTLKAAFDCYHTLITRYFLTECDRLLSQIHEACLARGTWSMFYFMAIQAFSFLRFKQGRYQESVDFFNQQIEIEGPNDIIFENMALAYSRLNQKQQASTCYAEAYLMIQEKSKNEERLATLLVGLSTVLEQPQDALVVLEEGLRLLNLKYSSPHSLMAKTLSAMGDYYMKLHQYREAEQAYQRAVSIFIDTCGKDTPLTSTALQKHGESLIACNKIAEGIKTLIDALNVWNAVDPASFDATSVAQIMIFLNEQMKTNTSLISHNRLQGILQRLEQKIVTTETLNNSLNDLCLLKFIYEWHALNKDITKTMRTCQLLQNLLEQMDEKELGETAPYRKMLLEQTNAILNLSKTIKK